MLAQLGYDVTRAASAAAALGALADGRPIDRIFSDIMMPGGMNGVELAREVQRRRSDVPVLLTSGYSEAAAEDAARAGVQILPKP
ncbi:response regulator, partial [Acinetobacter baumannii]